MTNRHHEEHDTVVLCSPASRREPKRVKIPLFNRKSASFLVLFPEKLILSLPLCKCVCEGTRVPHETESEAASCRRSL